MAENFNILMCDKEDEDNEYYDSEKCNAKEEFLRETKGKTIVCAQLIFRVHGEETWFLLKRYFDHNDYCEFLKRLDFTYDSGCGGGGEIRGYIWYNDGTWSE